MAWVCGRAGGWVAPPKARSGPEGGKRKAPATTATLRRPASADRAARRGADPSSCDTSLGRRLGEIDLSVGELMAQQADVSRGEPVPFRNHFRGEPLAHGGAQSLIATL